MHPERRPNPDRSPEALEARLRALPPPPVPADLEARLLAAIPAKRPSARRWAVWAGVVGALAAACLLAVLGWPRRPARAPVPGPETRESAHKVPPRPAEEDGIAALREARRVEDGGEPAPFTWPLDETPVGVSTSIPPELFD
jgi:hypothetical protein